MVANPNITPFSGYFRVGGHTLGTLEHVVFLSGLWVVS
jgi:hypothetical protein